MKSTDKRLWPSFVIETVSGGPLSIYEIVHADHSVYSENMGDSHFAIRDLYEDGGDIWMSMDGEHVAKPAGVRIAKPSEFSAKALRCAMSVAGREFAVRVYPIASLKRLQAMHKIEEVEHEVRWNAYKAAKATATRGLSKTPKVPGPVKLLPRPDHALVKPQRRRS